MGLWIVPGNKGVVMAKTIEDLHSYLVQLNLSYEEPLKDTLIIRGIPGIDNLVIRIADTVVVFRVKVMNLPQTKQKELFAELLKINASEMLHGAYGLEGDSLVISDALQLENLDFNEFAATLDDISLAIASHSKRLGHFMSEGGVA